MSEPQFFQTRMGKVYYEATLPGLVNQITRLNELLERLIDRLETADDRDGNP